MLEIKTQMREHRIFGEVPEHHLFDGEEEIAEADNFESLALRAAERGVYIKVWWHEVPELYENILDLHGYNQAFISNVKARNPGACIQIVGDVFVIMSRGIISMFNVIPEYKNHIDVRLYDALLNYTKCGLYFRVRRHQNGGKERFEFEAKWGVGFDAPYVDEYSMKAAVLVKANDRYHNVIAELGE